MSVSKKSRRAQLSRRLFLGGAGALVALPAMESLIGDRAHADDAFPARTLCYYVPNGIHMAADNNLSRGVIVCRFTD